MNNHYAIVEVIGETEDTEGRVSWGYALLNLDTSVFLSKIYKNKEDARAEVEEHNNWGLVVSEVPDEVHQVKVEQ